MFWDGIKSVKNGFPSPCYVQFSAAFQAQGSQQFQGRVRAIYYNQEIALVPGNKVLPVVPGAVDHGTVSVYWLPWQNQQMNFVLLKDLNNSGCDFFMTSEFSGCRFVITDEYIAHVAHWVIDANHYTPLTTRSLGRTNKEKSIRETMRMGTPKLYRAISSSDLSGSQADGFGANDTQILSYFQAGLDVDRTLVFGYKDPKSIIGWSFKYLTFTSDKKVKPVWHEVPLPSAYGRNNNPNDLISF